MGTSWPRQLGLKERTALCSTLDSTILSGCPLQGRLPDLGGKASFSSQCFASMQFCNRCSQFMWIELQTAQGLLSLLYTWRGFLYPSFNWLQDSQQHLDSIFPSCQGS